MEIIVRGRARRRGYDEKDEEISRIGDNDTRFPGYVDAPGTPAYEARQKALRRLPIGTILHAKPTKFDNLVYSRLKRSQLAFEASNDPEFLDAHGPIGFPDPPELEETRKRVHERYKARYIKECGEQGLPILEF